MPPALRVDAQHAGQVEVEHSLRANFASVGVHGVSGERFQYAAGPAAFLCESMRRGGTLN
jgi:hypothetical protein